VNGLEYEIDCEHNDKCLKIKKKGDENKEDKINKGDDTKDDTYINPNRLYL